MQRAYTVETAQQQEDGSIVDKPDETKTYRGFDRAFSPASEVEHVVLVQDEDHVDVFVLENPKKASGLMAYLADEMPWAKVIGVFTRTK